ncbi:MAG: mismatch repair protein MutT [Herbinix sp.]|jgi:8-oxo-dGTP diphosphatase|nr:mismatch repair protein MutT [Herbinix sp.]
MENKIIVALKAIIIYNRKALIIQRSYGDVSGSGSWEFAGGKLEFGEDLESGLKREIMEEVGLEVMIERLLYASTFQSKEKRQTVILNYLCHSNGDHVTLSEEHERFQWADKKTMKKFLTKGILYDLENNKIFDQIDIIDE